MTTVLQILVDGLSRGSTIALTTLGVVLIFGIMRLVNFAHGEFVMIGALALVFLAPVSTPLAIVAALGAPVIGALVVERVAFRPIRAADHSTMLVTSFALSFLLQSLAVLFFGSATRSVDVLPALSEQLHIGGLVLPVRTLVICGVSIALLVGVALFLTRSRTGVQMRAAAADFEMARLLGVRANRVIGTAFAISGVLAGTAAIAVVSETGTVEATIGVHLVLVAFTAAVLGGMESLVGATIGAFVVGIVSVVAESLLPPSARGYRDSIMFGVFIVVLLVRPRGLFVRADRTERI